MTNGVQNHSRLARLLEQVFLKSAPMRNLLILLALLALTSCEKKYCWQCVDTVHKNDSLTSSIKTEVCDKTEKEIQEMESSKGFSRTVGGVTWDRTCTK
jgi:hypothetical protein